MGRSPAWLRACLLSVAVLVATARSAGATDFAPNRCPAVGNRFSGIYHVQGDVNYRQMLHRNADRRLRDNRQCFPSAAAAERAGYRRSRAPKVEAIVE